MGIIINLLLSGLAVVIAAYVLPGIKVDGYFTAIVVAVVLGIVNAVLKPILLALTLPINMLTLGFFTFVVNALLVMLVASIVPGFMVDGFAWALAFSLVLYLVNYFLHSISK